MARYYGIGRTFRKGNGGIPAKVVDSELVRDSIFQALATGAGERVMRPSFGSRISDSLFETENVVLNGLLKRETQRVISRFEPRAKVLSVTPHIEDTTTFVDIVFSVLGVEDSVSVPIR